jgi:hypothetical protein
MPYVRMGRYNLVGITRGYSHYVSDSHFAKSRGESQLMVRAEVTTFIRRTPTEHVLSNSTRYVSQQRKSDDLPG